MTFYNQIIDKGSLKKLIAWAFRRYGSSRSAVVADKLKDLGFRYATKAGVSISIDDLQVPPIKRQLLEQAETEIRHTEQRYAKGQITEVERFQKVIDTWNSTSENLKDEVVRNFKQTDPLNSVYMMAFSGARGNLSQVRQLVGMRGLMADPQGEIIDLPIKTNFREGLTVTEYVISSYGARKGLVDTALRTADSGYLTRRLVDVSQDVIVREHDCGTQRSLTVEPMKDGGRTLIPLADRLFGRILAQDVVHPQTGAIIARRNQQVDGDLAEQIGAAVETVQVRSPLTCEAARSVCQQCYGWSLAHGKSVDLGEAVGIIAAQSIGEPGTQLTMRTFHTGGVFTGEVAQQIRAEGAGTVTFAQGLATRKVRTRHGDDREQVEVAGNLILSLSGRKTPRTYALNPGTLLFVGDGQAVAADQLLAEVTSAKVQRSTEKATKDVATDLAGEIQFADLVAEEKIDRQGNITHAATRGGLIWVLAGEVYNLLPGAEATVSNGDRVAEGDILATTKLTSVSGGVVRLTPGSREIEIVTASVLLDQAQVRLHVSGTKEQYLIDTAHGEQFLLKAAPGTKVANRAIVAELVDDRYQTPSGGILKYGEVEVARGNRKQGYEVVKGGTLLWIPEETHEINKDISLLLVEDGEYVEAGTEIVKDIFCQCSGLVEVIQKNDILREITVKPGDLHLELEEFPESGGELLGPGTDLGGGVVLEQLRWVELVETTEGPALLLRPVTEYVVADEPAVPSQGSINQEGGQQIQLRSVQRMFHKDGERVKSVEGCQLLSTQLVLEIEGRGANLTADIELVDPQTGNGEHPEHPEHHEVQRLQLVILESLVLRREGDSDPLGGNIHTKLLVEDGEQIPPGAIVARTEISAKEAGMVRGIRAGEEAIRRLLLVGESDLLTLELPAPPTIAEGDLVVAGMEMASGFPAPESGVVVSVKNSLPPSPPSKGRELESQNEAGSSENSSPPHPVSPSPRLPLTLTLRRARPYRVSTGAILHVANGDLVQRGDNLVLLVFERSKTGDIIQGLPRIEELLEARKPKEACVLSRRPGTCQVEYWEDETVDVKVVEADGTVSDYPLGPGQSAIVSDGQEVGAAEPLTDGPANPHEILEVFFDYYVDEKGVYEAALIGLQQVQKFLVHQVQQVYQSQGIDIGDKHIEVIVRQMTSKVRVDDGGDTTILPGELVELRQIEQVNEAMGITGGAPARYTPVLLGITKASLNTDSFISAASFQETTRVLTEAAIEGKSDWLRGLKENVIIGRLIPAGTGFHAQEEYGSSGLNESRSSSANHTGEADSSSSYEVLVNPEEVVLDDHTARAYADSDGLDEEE